MGSYLEVVNWEAVRLPLECIHLGIKHTELEKS
jgi:hypothetical protein